MEQKEIQPTETNLDADLQVSLDIANNPSTGRQIDDAAVMSRATQASERMAAAPTPRPTSFESMTKTEKALVAGVIGITTFSAGAMGVAAVNQFDQDTVQKQEQNQEWADEAQEQRQLEEQQMVSENKITIDLPAENSEDK